MANQLNNIVFAVIAVLFVYGLFYISENYIILKQKFDRLFMSLYPGKMKRKYAETTTKIADNVSEKIVNSLNKGNKNDKIVRVAILMTIGVTAMILSSVLK